MEAVAVCMYDEKKIIRDVDITEDNQFVLWIYYPDATEENLKYLDLNDNWYAQWFIHDLSKLSCPSVSDYYNKVNSESIIYINSSYSEEGKYFMLPQYGYVRYYFDIDMSRWCGGYGRIVEIGKNVDIDEINFKKNISPELWLCLNGKFGVAVYFYYYECHEVDGGTIVKAYGKIENEMARNGFLLIGNCGNGDGFDMRMERMLDMPRRSSGGVFKPISFMLPFAWYVGSAEKQIDDLKELYGKVPVMALRLDPESYLAEKSVFTIDLISMILERYRQDYDVILLEKKITHEEFTVIQGISYEYKYPNEVKRIFYSEKMLEDNSYIYPFELEENIFKIGRSYYWIPFGEYREFYEDGEWWIEKTGDEPLIIEVFDY